MKSKFFQLLILCVSLLPIKLYGQDDLLDMLDSGISEPRTPVVNTFSTTRIINCQSVEVQPKGSLDFRISHRFGPLNDGAYGAYGLDKGYIRIAFEYAPSDRLLVGVGRNSSGKVFDGFAKYRILRQENAGGMPFSLNYLGATNISGLHWADTTRKNLFSSRLTYTHQLLFAKKFGDYLSLQFAPTLIHTNLVVDRTDHNDRLALGVGARYKVSRVMFLTGEYFITQKNNLADSSLRNNLSLGVDFKVGAHVFQMFLTNAISMIEAGFIGNTNERWMDGGIHFGFNVSRVFALGKHDN